MLHAGKEMLTDEARKGAYVTFTSVDPEECPSPPDICEICAKGIPLFRYDRYCNAQSGSGYCCDSCAFDLIGDVFGATHEATLRADAEELPDEPDES